jgi:hypothetical protein
MPRFTLRTLFLSTTLIAVGIWLAMFSANWIRSNIRPGIAPHLLFVMAGAMFCAAAFAPFGRAKRGAILGAVITTVALLLRFVD